MLVERVGNLFNFEHQAYAQGVTNLGIMGRGIATTFKTQYPLMFSEYKDLCRKGLLNPGEVQLYEEDPIILNLITQDNHFRANKDYLVESIKKMYVLARQKEITDIAMPEIGCGLGNLNISDLKTSLQPFVTDSTHNVTIYHFNQLTS